MTRTTAKAPDSSTPVRDASVRTRRYRLFFLTTYALVLLLFTAVLQRRSASDSRLDTMVSLVKRGTFALGSPGYDTIAKVYINGRYYSHQPPLQAIVGAAIYYPLWRLGFLLRPPRSVSYVAVTFVLIGISAVVTLLFFYQALRFTALPDHLRLSLTVLLGAGTLLLPYGTTLNNHEFTAALLSIGFYYFLKSGEHPSAIVSTVLSSISFGLAGASDHAMLALYGTFAVCVLFQPNWRARLVAFAVPGALALVPTFVYYYLIGHSIKPFAGRPELFSYPGSVWSSSGNSEYQLTGASFNNFRFALMYGTSLLLGSRGFLLYNPTSLFALFGLGRVIRRKDRHWREAIAIAVASAAVIGYYSFASVNSSGACYSIRWFVPLLPPWCFFWPNAMEVFDFRHSLAIKATCALAVFLAFAGALNPWPWPVTYQAYLIPIKNVYRAIAPETAR